MPKRKDDFVKIKRIFNNNVVLAFEGDSEIVIFGKGIGFQKNNGDKLDKGKVEKIFRLSKTETSQIESLFKEISTEYATLTLNVIKQAESDLKVEFNSSIYITIMDHINYALIRAQEGIFIKNELLWEIKRTYRNEFEAAKISLEIINANTGIQLLEDEAGIIAIHYFNGQDPNKIVKASYKSVQIIQDILKIIQFHYNIELDENDITFSRMMTHLRYFVNELLTNEKRITESENEFLYSQMKLKYPNTHECVKKIKKYVIDTLQKEFVDDEALYLMIHLQRIYEKSKKGS